MKIEAELLEQVKAATGPDAELELAIVEHVHGRKERMIHKMHHIRAYEYLSSVDAALALVDRVLPSLVIQMTKIGDGTGMVQVTEAWISGSDIEVVSTWSPMDPKPPALAIITALLSALEAQP